MNVQAFNSLKKAKMGLLLNDPFFAFLVINLEMIEVDNPFTMPTAATDGKKIYYNPNFINSLTEAEIVGLLCHEILHIAYFHLTRINGRNLKKWNRAADYVINTILQDAGYSLPKCGLLDTQYRGMSTEVIYDKLEDQEEDDWNFGGFLPADLTDEDGNKISVQELEASIKQNLASAYKAAKKQGIINGIIEKNINGVLNPKVPWRQLLSRWLTRNSKDDYTWKKFNDRWSLSGFKLPRLETEKLGDIYIFVDTSGSIDVDQLTNFVAEVKGITDLFNQSITLLYIDTKVQGMQTIEPNDTAPLDVKGFGGTDFRPGFDYLETEGIVPDGVLYFTDGYCNSFPSETDYHTMWVIDGNNENFEPPFGEVIYLNQ